MAGSVRQAGGRKEFGQQTVGDAPFSKLFDDRLMHDGRGHSPVGRRQGPAFAAQARGYRLGGQAVHRRDEQIDRCEALRFQAVQSELAGGKANDAIVQDAAGERKRRINQLISLFKVVQ